MISYIFLDTNVYLHFIQFDQIKWNKLLNDDNITIIVPSIIISELDKHKFNKNERISKKARAVLKQFKSFKNAGASNKTFNVEFHLKEPKPITFTENQLDKDISDDRIIASIIEFKTNNPARVVLVSGDTGIVFKAELHKIEIFQLPEEYLSKLGMNLEEKKIKELEKEILLLKNRIPDLKIHFDNNEDIIKLPMKKNIYDEYNIKERMDRLKKDFPYKTFEKAYHNKFDSVLNFLVDLTPLNKQSVDWYNKDLNKYFADYETFLIKYIDYIKIYSTSYRIRLMLENKGTTPADDIHINIHIPDGMEIVSNEKYPNEPKRPEAPVLKSVLSLLSTNSDINKTILFPVIPKINLQSRNISGLNIRKTNSYNIDVQVKRLMHNNEVFLDPFYVKFDDVESAFSFDFTYSIIAENIPRTITKKLSFVIIK